MRVEEAVELLLEGRDDEITRTGAAADRAAVETMVSATCIKVDLSIEEEAAMVIAMSLGAAED